MARRGDSGHPDCVRSIWILLVVFATHARAEEVTLLLGGDVALPTGPNDVALDALGPRVFEHVAPFIRAADVAFANLEAPLTRAAPTVKKAFPMTMPPERIAWVAADGFDLLSLANWRCLIIRPQDAGVLQRRKIEARPAIGICCQQD